MTILHRFEELCREAHWSSVEDGNDVLRAMNEGDFSASLDASVSSSLLRRRRRLN